MDERLSCVFARRFTCGQAIVQPSRGNNMSEAATRQNATRTTLESGGEP